MWPEYWSFNSFCCLLSSAKNQYVGIILLWFCFRFPSQLLREISANSPECSINWGPTPAGASDDSDPASCLNKSCFNMEALTGEQIIAQCHLDQEAIDACSDRRGVSPASDSGIQTGQRTCLTPTSPLPTVFDPFSKWTVHSNQFAVVRHLLNQLGFLSWERRRTVELIEKSPSLVRDLKHLDKLGARETHKIAVFYVGAGQEDKQSILSNQTASLEFENFVAGLGWEVDLHTHRGFRGGLERSGRAGNSTPYYATATAEVIFHVSTRMPSSTQEDLKYKHLGNDEVMIIWTENTRAFSRSMLRTQFGDVLIIIAPLHNGLFRVEVRRESDVGFFGPIVQFAILDSSVLPALVRATAINASRAIRTMKPGYRAQYPFHLNEERASSLRQLISRHTSQACFEVFAESLFLTSATNDSAMPPNPGQQSTDANETVVTRVKDYPAESGSVDLVPVSVATAPSATPVPPTANVINSRAGPVAKVSSLPSSQYRVSFVDDRVAARSRDRFPLITTHSATPVQTLEDNGSYTNSVSRNHQSPKQRSRHHTQYSSVDRTYKHHCRSDKSPVAVSPSTNVRHSTFLQPASHVSTPPDHSYHLKNLLSYKSHRHT
ncbi:RGPA2 [Fasciolopsis buskii]|uniref:RGPA2 n=1 Tax=Fasciolopsis buskii TaxID=27845 RepID=A0A8E0RQT4_9TREM|nr:RGPA2 [Fasciolopsis buski]